MAPGAGEDEEQGTETIEGDEGLEDNDPMNPSAWYGEPNVCGSCIAWRPEDPRPGETVAAGACKLRPELGRVPATLKKCSIYKPRGQFVYDPGRASPTRRRKTGAARVLRRSAEGEMVPSRPPPRAATPQAVFERRERDVEYEWERMEPGDAERYGEGSTEPRPDKPVVEVPRTVELGGDDNGPVVRQALVELIRREHGRSTREIHSKFRTGGVAIARTAAGREVKIPAERFFAILDRLRASLDALEGAIEARSELGEDKQELVASIRRMHGSFTTFNLMFSDRDDYFSGKE